MKASIYHGPGAITFEEVAPPSFDPERDAMLIRVMAVGVCGTDVKTYRRGHPMFHPPCILGHELAGVVDAIGRGMPEERFKEGDRVAVAPYVSCGACFHCRHGQEELCESKYGLSNGAFAEYVVVSGGLASRGVIAVPESVSTDQAALAEPLACCVNAIEDCRLRPGDTVLIVGGGPMGLLNLQVAMASGAGRVIVSELHAGRLEIARRFGGIGLDPGEIDVVKAVKEITEGRGADAVILCVGSEELIGKALALVRRGGIVDIFGGLPSGSRTTIDPNIIHYGQVSLVGSFGFTLAQFAQSIRLMESGKVDVAPLITHRMPLEGLEDAFRLVMAQEALKVIVHPTQGR